MALRRSGIWNTIASPPGSQLSNKYKMKKAKKPLFAKQGIKLLIGYGEDGFTHLFGDCIEIPIFSCTKCIFV
jgi:hypothetical protein